MSADSGFHQTTVSVHDLQKNLAKRTRAGHSSNGAVAPLSEKQVDGASRRYRSGVGTSCVGEQGLTG